MVWYHTIPYCSYVCHPHDKYMFVASSIAHYFTTLFLSDHGDATLSYFNMRSFSSLLTRYMATVSTFQKPLQMTRQQSSSTTANMPRPAVSSVLQWLPPCHNDPSKPSTPHYLLIQRGQPPNEGKWSLPGGKLDWGETALEGAQREFAEEVQLLLPPNKDKQHSDHTRVAWHPHAFTTSDALGEGYHYLIAQCFGQVVVDDADGDNMDPPVVQATDDAKNARWIKLDELPALTNSGGGTMQLTPGVERVLARAHALWQAGLLPTTIYKTPSESVMLHKD